MIGVIVLSVVQRDYPLRGMFIYWNALIPKAGIRFIPNKNDSNC